MMLEDHPFIDVDFSKDPHFVFGDTTPDGEKFLGMQEYGDVYETIDDSLVDGLIEQQEAAGGGSEWFIKYILNQLREGSCVGNAETAMQMILQALQFGLDNVILLSAISMYKQIGSSANSGANVADALDASANVGQLPLDTPENRAKFGSMVMPATGFSTPFPTGWKDTAKLFRTAKSLVVKNIAQMNTCLLNKHPVQVGRQGHSITYVKVFLKNGKRNYLYVNSWGDWGIPAGKMPYGFGVDSVSTGLQSSRWAYTTTQVVDYRGNAA